MDGRIQEPIISFLKEHWKVQYIDCITEAGPCKILSDKANTTLVDSITDRIEISVSNHKSKLIAISGHYDCVANHCCKKEQVEQVKQSVLFIKSKYPDVKIIGLWIDDEWEVNYC